MASSYSVTHSGSSTTSQSGGTSTTTTTTQDAGKVSQNTQRQRAKYNKGYQQSAQVQNYYNQLQDNMSYRPSDQVNQAYQNWQNYAGGYQQSEAVKQAYANLQSKMNYGGYDFNRDAVYQTYKDIYTQQGKSAMRDTVAQSAALTGGYGNSWAQTAGQQQYQAYLQQLNAMIPQLAEQDYNRWNSERSFAMDYYKDTRDFDYNQFATERENAYRTYTGEREFDYGQFADNRSFLAGMYQNERDYDYNQYVNNRDYWNNEYWQERKSKQKTNSTTRSSQWSNSSTSSYSNTSNYSDGGGSGGSGGSDDRQPAKQPHTVGAWNDGLYDYVNKKKPHPSATGHPTQYYNLPRKSRK